METERGLRLLKAEKGTARLITELSAVGWFKESQLSVMLPADFRCEYCGQDLLASFNECFNAQSDHIVPKSKGGADTEWNLAACCTTCNSLKWDYVPHGESRDERIADAARYVHEQRQAQEVLWRKCRALMGR